MGLVCLPTWMADFYGKLVGTYTNHMDGMGRAPLQFLNQKNISGSEFLSSDCWRKDFEIGQARGQDLKIEWLKVIVYWDSWPKYK